VKACTKCSGKKPLKEFNKSSKAKDGRKARCRSCQHDDYMDERPAAFARAEKWRLANLDKVRIQQDRYNLRVKYGITPEEYDRFMVQQNGRCAICEKPPTKLRLDVDHDHVTKKVRGLLHNHCNRALGYFGDDPDVLDSAAAYLRRNK
jgi:hypothetical protein